MTLDSVALVSYIVAAVTLLGSPGPGIAALIAAARAHGFGRSLGFYGGLQLGLALVAGLCAAGLSSVLSVAPLVGRALSVAAAAYLIYLAWKIASAPVGGPQLHAPAAAPTPFGGFLLGLTNPKAYVAMASLMAAYTVVRNRPAADTALKWAACVAVILVVDLAWLWFGGRLGAVRLGPRAERGLNLTMGAAVLAAGVAAVI